MSSLSPWRRRSILRTLVFLTCIIVNMIPVQHTIAQSDDGARDGAMDMNPNRSKIPDAHVEGSVAFFLNEGCALLRCADQRLTLYEVHAWQSDGSEQCVGSGYLLPQTKKWVPIALGSVVPAASRSGPTWVSCQPIRTENPCIPSNLKKLKRNEFMLVVLFALFPAQCLRDDEYPPSEHAIQSAVGSSDVHRVATHLKCKLTEYNESQVKAARTQYSTTFNAAKEHLGVDLPLLEVLDMTETVVASGGHEGEKEQLKQRLFSVVKNVMRKKNEMKSAVVYVAQDNESRYDSSKLADVPCADVFFVHKSVFPLDEDGLFILRNVGEYRATYMVQTVSTKGVVNTEQRTGILHLKEECLIDLSLAPYFSNLGKDETNWVQCSEYRYAENFHAALQLLKSNKTSHVIIYFLYTVLPSTFTMRDNNSTLVNALKDFWNTEALRFGGLYVLCILRKLSDTEIEDAGVQNESFFNAFNALLRVEYSARKTLKWKNELDSTRDALNAKEDVLNQREADLANRERALQDSHREKERTLRERENALLNGQKEHELRILEKKVELDQMEHVLREQNDFQRHDMNARMESLERMEMDLAERQAAAQETFLEQELALQLRWTELNQKEDKVQQLSVVSINSQHRHRTPSGCESEKCALGRLKNVLILLCAVLFVLVLVISVLLARRRLHCNNEGRCVSVEEMLESQSEHRDSLIEDSFYLTEKAPAVVAHSLFPGDSDDNDLLCEEFHMP